MYLFCTGMFFGEALISMLQLLGFKLVEANIGQFFALLSLTATFFALHCTKK